MRHLVIGQRQKAPNFSAFHWSSHGCLITIAQHFVTTRVVHLPKRTKTSLITESDQSRANHQLLQLCTVRTAWSESDQAVRAVHSCKSWLKYYLIRFLDDKNIEVLDCLAYSLSDKTYHENTWPHWFTDCHYPHFLSTDMIGQYEVFEYLNPLKLNQRWKTS